MKTTILIPLLLSAGGILAASDACAWESALFGSDWEATPALSFESDKILQDFSFAGYRRGEVPLPDKLPRKIFDVTKFGADPSGTKDSTGAIQRALDAASAAGGGTVWLPSGTYQLSPQDGKNYCLGIPGSKVVLRGAGPEKTFLLNKESVMKGKSIICTLAPDNYRWSVPQNPTTKIVADLPGPISVIPVANVAGFNVGDLLIVRADPGDEWAKEHVEPEWVGFAGKFGSLMYWRQITAIDAKANTITIDIPTRYTLKMRDNARVYKKPQTISEVGVEGFSIGNIQHPGTDGWGEEDCYKPGTSAYDVAGCYAIVFKGVRNGWIRDVVTFLPKGNTTGCHILNNGILLDQCQNVTVQNACFQRPQYGGAGGAGYMYRVQNSGDCLLVNCTAEFSRHGFVFSHMGSSGNVLHACLDKVTGKQTGSTGDEKTSGSCSDHHMHFSHSNLIDACVADDSAFVAFYRPWGDIPKHNLTAAHSVFWNTEGRGKRSFVVQSDQSRYGYVIGTRGEVTGVKTDASPKTQPADHVEGIGMGDSLTPFSLFLEQRRRRLKLPAVEPNAQPGGAFQSSPNDAEANRQVIHFLKHHSISILVLLVLRGAGRGRTQQRSRFLAERAGATDASARTPIASKNRPRCRSRSTPENSVCAANAM